MTRELLSTQHYTAADQAEAERHFAELDAELARLVAGVESPAWYARKVATAPAADLELAHSSTARDGYVFCATAITRTAARTTVAAPGAAPPASPAARVGAGAARRE